MGKKQTNEMTEGMAEIFLNVAEARKNIDSALHLIQVISMETKGGTEWE